METKSVIDMLKRALKFHMVTYADIAYELNLSEASVKRMFAKQHFTIERLESICSMVNLNFTDLVRLVDEDQHRLSNLTPEQEEELVSDLKFLLIAICTQSNWTFEEIISYYKFSEPECVKYLARLDKLGLIQLLPNNRIRQMVSKDFRWLSRGPIEKFFEKVAQSKFLESHFTRPGEIRLFKNGMLSRVSVNILRNKVEMLAREFTSFQYDDARLSADERINTGLMIAIRPWELPIFSKLKRRHADT
jgi:DNA-binding Xre family transcriptional regulator